MLNVKQNTNLFLYFIFYIYFTLYMKFNWELIMHCYICILKIYLFCVIKEYLQYCLWFIHLSNHHYKNCVCWLEHSINIVSEIVNINQKLLSKLNELMFCILPYKSWVIIRKRNFKYTFSMLLTLINRLRNNKDNRYLIVTFNFICFKF